METRKRIHLRAEVIGNSRHNVRNNTRMISKHYRKRQRCYRSTIRNSNFIGTNENIKNLFFREILESNCASMTEALSIAQLKKKYRDLNKRVLL